MHQSRPYGLHAIGLPLTDKDEAFVSNVAARITNLQELSGIDSMKMVYDLPDGGYVIVQDMGGNFRVISHKPIDSKELEFDGIETGYIPMLFSGVITKPVVHENEPVGLRLTEAARLRLVNYDKIQPLPAKDIELQRFRVDYNDRFSEFKPRFPSSILRTQYVQQSPSWYSGAMSEVMQIVGGYGRQDFDNLLSEDVNRFERARVILPADVQQAIDLELLSLRLPGYTGLPQNDGSFQYDYKFNNTNAVSFDDSGLPWLLRIDSSGVYAMPLPIVPATRTVAFRRYMEQVGDDEVIAILNRFGGMPSGETFPNYQGFDAWRRAGVIIKVCDTSDFYHHVAYSSSCGWSLNSKGSEGYNTCYNYDDDGLGYGLTYNLSLKLSSTDEYYGALPVDVEVSDFVSSKVEAYLVNLIPLIGNNTSEDRALLFKLRRVDKKLLYDRALISDGSNDKDYWRNLELDPIANHTGSVKEVYRGYLYHGARFNQQPQIKFPEPFLGGCISHDFLPLMEGRYKEQYPNCDTIMFAYYVGDTLKTIKYFIDWGKFQKEVVSNFEPYMTAGQWQKVESIGKSQLQGCFYSSDIDDREVVSPTVTTTDVVGIDRGYDSRPFFTFDAFFSMVGVIWRNRYFTHKTNTKTVSGRQLELAVCVPYLCRNAAIHTKREYIEGINRTEQLEFKAVRDPNSYNYWTYHKDLAWAHMSIKNPKGTPFPENGNPVWVEERNYNPSPANNFADNGDWIGGLPADYTWLVHPESNVWQHNGGGGAPSVNAYYTASQEPMSSNGYVRFSIDDQPYLVNKDMPENSYYIGSPNFFGDYFYKDACQVFFGDTFYRNVSEPSERSARAFWGSCKLVDHTWPHHFIGVINE